MANEFRPTRKRDNAEIARQRRSQEGYVPTAINTPAKTAAPAPVQQPKPAPAAAPKTTGTSQSPGYFMSNDTFKKYADEHAYYKANNAHSADFGKWYNESDLKAYNAINTGKSGTKSMKTQDGYTVMDDDTYKKYANEHAYYKQNGKHSADFGKWYSEDGLKAYNDLHKSGKFAVDEWSYGLDPDMLERTRAAYQDTWRSNYTVSADDIARANAGQIPKKLEKKYKKNDPYDQWLLNNGLPPKSSFYDAYNDQIDALAKETTKAAKDDKTQATYQANYQNALDTLNNVNAQMGQLFGEKGVVSTGQSTILDALNSGNYGAAFGVYNTPAKDPDEDETLAEAVARMNKAGGPVISEDKDPIYDKAYQTIMEGKEAPGEDFLKIYKESDWQKFLKSKMGWNESDLSKWGITDTGAFMQQSELARTNAGIPNVDLTNLSIIPAAALKEKGWDTDGGYTALNSQIKKLPGSDKCVLMSTVYTEGEGDNKHTVVMTKDGFERYAGEYIRTGEDPKGLVLGEYESEKAAKSGKKQIDGVVKNAYGLDKTDDLDKYFSTLGKAAREADIAADKTGKRKLEYEAMDLYDEKERLYDDMNQAYSNLYINDQYAVSEYKKLQKQYEDVVDKYFNKYSEIMAKENEEKKQKLLGLSANPEALKQYVEAKAEYEPFHNEFEAQKKQYEDAVAGLRDTGGPAAITFEDMFGVSYEEQEARDNELAGRMKAAQNNFSGDQVPEGLSYVDAELAANYVTIDGLTKQYETAPEKALTIKTTSDIYDNANALYELVKNGNAPKKDEDHFQRIAGIMSEDEKKALINMIESGHMDDAKKFFDGYDQIATSFESQDDSLRWQKLAEKYPTYASLQSAGLITSQIPKAYEGIRSLIDVATGSDKSYIDRMAEAKATNRSSTIRGYVSQNIYNRNGNAGEVLSFIYGTGMSMGENLARMPIAILTGGAGEAISLGVMGAEVFSDTFQQTLANGGSIGDATLGAGVSAFAEIITEKVSLESFLSMWDSGYFGSIGELFKHLGIQAINESSEEFASTCINGMYDVIKNGRQNDYMKQGEEIVAQIKAGTSTLSAAEQRRILESKDPVSKAGWLVFFKEAGLDALGGALSGIGFGAIGAFKANAAAGGMTSVAALGKTKSERAANFMSAEQKSSFAQQIGQLNVSDEVKSGLTMFLDQMAEDPAFLLTQQGQGGAMASALNSFNATADATLEAGKAFMEYYDAQQKIRSAQKEQGIRENAAAEGAVDMDADIAEATENIQEFIDTLQNEALKSAEEKAKRAANENKRALALTDAFNKAAQLRAKVQNAVDSKDAAGASNAVAEYKAAVDKATAIKSDNDAAAAVDEATDARLQAMRERVLNASMDKTSDSLQKVGARIAPVDQAQEITPSRYSGDMNDTGVIGSAISTKEAQRAVSDIGQRHVEDIADLIVNANSDEEASRLMADADSVSKGGVMSDETAAQVMNEDEFSNYKLMQDILNGGEDNADSGTGEAEESIRSGSGSVEAERGTRSTGIATDDEKEKGIEKVKQSWSGDFGSDTSDIEAIPDNELTDEEKRISSVYNTITGNDIVWYKSDSGAGPAGSNDGKDMIMIKRGTGAAQTIGHELFEIWRRNGGEEFDKAFDEAVGLSDSLKQSFRDYYRFRVGQVFGRDSEQLKALTDEYCDNEFIQELAGIWYQNTFGTGDGDTSFFSYMSVFTGSGYNVVELVDAADSLSNFFMDQIENTHSADSESSGYSMAAPDLTTRDRLADENPQRASTEFQRDMAEATDTPVGYSILHAPDIAEQSMRSFDERLKSSGNDEPFDRALAVAAEERLGKTLEEIAKIAGKDDNFSRALMVNATEKAQELADYVRDKYMGKADRNGLPLLPEEVYKTLSNNIFSNASYLKDAEPSTECYRQAIFRALYDDVVDIVGRPLTTSESQIVNQAAIEIGIDAPCIYCYSLQDRKAKEAYKLQYLAERDAFMNQFDKDYNGDKEAFARDAEKNFKKYYELYLSRKIDPAGKDAKGRQKSRSDNKKKVEAGAATDKQDRVRLWMELYAKHWGTDNMVKASDVRHITTQEYDEELYKTFYDQLAAGDADLKERAMRDLQKWVQASSQAKKIIPYTAYSNFNSDSILKWSQSTIDALNNEYGLRWYSHADFHPAFVVDNIQQFIDASQLGLKGLMYCKPIEAAKIFAPTGCNINISTFLEFNDGTYVSDDRLGAPMEQAKALREKYPNVGIVTVTTSDDATLWAISQDYIDVVIPIHLVRSGADFIEEFGLTDYTKEQADKIDGKTAKAKYEKYINTLSAEMGIAVKDAETGKKTKEYNALFKSKKSVYPKEHQNDYNLYMSECTKRGLTPRFDRFREAIANGEIYNGDVQITPAMYMKLVNETRQSESMTQPLQPIFDWDAAYEAVDQLPEKGYFEYFQKSAKWTDSDGVQHEGGEQEIAQQAARDILLGKKPNELGYGRTLITDNRRVLTSKDLKKMGVGGRHDPVQKGPTWSTTGNYSLMEPEEIHRVFDGQETITVYRAMQLFDGKLYPPMAAVVDGEMVGGLVPGDYVKSDERPDLAVLQYDKKGNVKIDKETGEPAYFFVLKKGTKSDDGKKQTDIPARYNPYIHTSRGLINDQFSSAWNRSHLVTVEVEIPASELTSGYKAEKAKDAVGELTWKSGPVSGELAKNGEPRYVILSRYCKIVRIVPNSEVATKYAEKVNKYNIEVPFNTVNPDLREALIKEGVKIGRPQKGNAGDSAVPSYKLWKSSGNYSLITPTGERVDRGLNIGADAISGVNYAVELANGGKLNETRPALGSIPKSMFHKWMALIDTSRTNYDVPMVVGYAKFGEPIDLSDPDKFDAYRDQTLITSEAEYNLKPGEKRYGYPVEDHMAIDPIPLPEGTRRNNRNRFFDQTEDVQTEYAPGSDIMSDVLNGKTSDNLRHNSIDNVMTVDDFMDFMLHKQISIGKNKYKTILNLSEQRNASRFSNGEPLPKFDIVEHDGNAYVYMNFDDQNYDVNQIFVDKMRVGSIKYNLMKERGILNELSRRYGITIGETYEENGYKSRYDDNYRDALKEYRRTISPDDGLYEKQPGNAGRNVFSRSSETEQNNTGRHGGNSLGANRGLDEHNNESTGNSAFSMPQNGNYSLVTPEQDARYMELAKDPERNASEISGMVRKAAEEAGYTTIGYHGTTKGGFTYFDRQKSDDGLTFFLADNDKLAATYSGSRSRIHPDGGTNNVGVYDLVADLGNSHVVDAHGEYWHSIANADEAKDLYRARIRTNTDRYYDDSMNVNVAVDYGAYVDEDGKIVQDEEDNWNMGTDFLGDFDSEQEAAEAIRNRFGNSAAERYLKSDLSEYEYNDSFVVDSNDNVIETEMTREIAQEAFDDGYDSVTIKNVRDSGSYGHGQEKGTIYILFDSNRIKSLDPVTYDTDGNIIPLSQRFNPESNDIRYSMSAPTGLTREQRNQMLAWDKERRQQATQIAEEKGVARQMNDEAKALKQASARIDHLRDQTDQLRQDVRRIISDRDVRLEGMKTAQRYAVQDQKEKDAYKVEREKLVKDTRHRCAELSDWLLSPEQNKSVPKPIQDVVRLALADIDWGAEDGHISNKHTRSWAARVQVLENMVLENEMHMNEDEDSDTALTFPPGLASAMNDLRKSLEESDVKFLSDMDNDQIKALRDTLQIIKGACQKINVLHGRLRGVSVADQGTRTVDYAAGAKAKKQSDNRWVRAFDDLINTEMFDAYSWAHRLGKGGEDMMANISDGLEKYYRRVREGSEWMNATMQEFNVTEKDINAWEKDQHTFLLESGDTVGLSTAQIMELYALSFRQQALKHLLDKQGGIEVAEVKGNRAYRNHNYKVTALDLDQMFATLTDDQKSFMHTLQQFLSTQCSKWGNEVTNELWMFDMYGGDPQYWPIKSAKGNIDAQAQQDPSAYNAILHSSFSNVVNRRANNPLMIGSAFDTFCNHVAQMATYNGLAIPIQDAMKWFNWKDTIKVEEVGSDGNVIERKIKDNNRTTKKAITRVMGRSGNSFFINLIKDLNGLSTGSTGTEISSLLVSNMKKAAIAGKLRVVIQQPTSILKAFAVINPTYFGKWDSGIKATIAEMQQHSDLAWWKSNGNFDIGTGKSVRGIMIGARTAYENISNKLMEPAGFADDFGWAQIWNACRNEMKARHPEIEVGSDAYWDAMNQRFSEIINKTQVIDTMLHRSQIMRSKDNAVKQVTSFMSEPIKTFNMLHTAIWDVLQGQQGAKKRLFNTVAGVSSAMVLNALILALHDSLRDRKDYDDYMNLFGNKLLDSLIDNANPLNMIPYISDVVSILQGYSADRMDMSAISDVVTAGKRLLTAIEKGGSNTYTTYGLISSFLKAASSLTGVPLAGLLSSGETFVNGLIPDTLPTKKDTSKQSKQRALVEAGISKKDARVFMEDYSGTGKNAEKAWAILDDFDGEEADIVADVLGLSYKPEKDGSLAEWGLAAAKANLKTAKNNFKKGKITEDELEYAQSEYDDYEQFFMDLIG